jgi:hypothetical protein
MIRPACKELGVQIVGVLSREQNLQEPARSLSPRGTPILSIYQVNPATATAAKSQVSAANDAQARRERQGST